jgi:hypothetical protein
VNVAEAVNQVEATGGTFRLDGPKVRVWYPGEEHRQELIRQIAFLRAHREEAAGFLRARAVIPVMPPGVRLIAWNLKEPPVAIEACAVVTDSAFFARVTLEQLRTALVRPKTWIGWSVPQLIDRLAQVGVFVALESAGGKSSDGKGRRCDG